MKSTALDSNPLLYQKSHYGGGGGDTQAPEDASHHPSGLSSSDYEGGEGGL